VSREAPTVRAEQPVRAEHGHAPAPQQRPMARPPMHDAPAAEARPAAPAPQAPRPAAPQGQDPHYKPRQGDLDPHGRAVPRRPAVEDDQLEIPAFLRRQAN
ncbi:MAG TPA: cell division protein FtsZ, partial [Hyphomicrobiales bacterium]|nr:cell division protein FtsZ [Hyphomicrobiales bacterium]